MKGTQRKPPIIRRTSFIVILCFCVCLFFSSVVQFTFMDDLYLFATQRSMKSISEQIIEMDFTKEDYRSLLSDIESNKDVYIEIYAPRDKLFYTTDSNDIVYEPSKKDTKSELKPRIMKITSHTDLPDGSYFEFRQEFYTSAKYIVYGVFFGENNGIEIYRSLDAMKENANTASWAFFGTTIALSIIILFIAILYASSVISPIIIMKDTTKKIARMDFSENCPPFKIKEIDELSDNINSLSLSLSNALNELQNENIRLESDIENKKKMEKIMRSFMANVSHELKTPISIIQGYAEGMKVGIGCDTTEEFCDIIIEESVKMNNLVCRLMEYLQYGSETYKTNKASFNISELLTNCIKMRSRKISEAQAEITIDVDESFYGFGDTELIANVFNNYLSNALSHLDFERKIIVCAKDNGNRYTVSLFNTGKQIPGTDIENIWESFYRGDKSHSRSEGRFGLGLSIVSMIQNLHSQKYGVYNRQNGVEFWFDIEKAEPHK